MSEVSKDLRMAMVKELESEADLAVKYPLAAPVRMLRMTAGLAISSLLTGVAGGWLGMTMRNLGLGAWSLLPVIGVGGITFLGNMKLFKKLHEKKARQLADVYSAAASYLKTPGGKEALEKSLLEAYAKKDKHQIKHLNPPA